MKYVSIRYNIAGPFRDWHRCSPGRPGRARINRRDRADRPPCAMTEGVAGATMESLGNGWA